MADHSKTWRGHGVSIPTKMRLHRALIQPIAIYGCETWTLITPAERKLCNDRIKNDTVSAQIGQDTQRRNSHKNRMQQDPSTAGPCQTKQMAWAVLRMDDERKENILLQGKVDGNRRRGKPRRA